MRVVEGGQKREAGLDDGRPVGEEHPSTGGHDRPQPDQLSEVASGHLEDREAPESPALVGLGRGAGEVVVVERACAEAARRAELAASVDRGLGGAFTTLTAVHPNESVLRDAYAAMAAGDGRALAQLLTTETTWVIRGRGKLAGSYRGPDEIFALWKAIAAQTGGGLQLEVKDVLANDARGVVLATARGERSGRSLEEPQVAVFEFAEPGRVRRATFIYEDPDAYDAFWQD